MANFYLYFSKKEKRKTQHFRESIILAKVLVLFKFVLNKLDVFNNLSVRFRKRKVVGQAAFIWFGGTCGVRSAECGVRSAECGVRSAECGVRSAECGVRSAECGVRSAECGVRSAECGVRSAECGVRSAECGVRSAECGVRGAECGVRSVENAECGK